MLPYATTLLLLAVGACAQDNDVQAAFARIPKLVDSPPKQKMTVIFSNAEVNFGDNLDFDDVSSPPIVETTQGYRGLYTIVAVMPDPPGSETACPGGQRLVQMRTNCRGGFERSTGDDVVPWNLNVLDFVRRGLIVIFGLQQKYEMGSDSVAENLNAACFYLSDYIRNNDITETVSFNYFYAKPVTRSIL